MGRGFEVWRDGDMYGGAREDPPPFTLHPREALARESRDLSRLTADNCGDQKGEISDSSRNREISPRAQISPGRDLPFEGGIWMAPKYRARQIPPFWSLQLSAVRGVLVPFWWLAVVYLARKLGNSPRIPLGAQITSQASALNGFRRRMTPEGGAP